MPLRYTDMLQLTIDGKNVEVPEGATILDAAGQAGVHIPTMCFLRPYEASGGCMVCAVRLAGTGELVPACARPAEHGMEVDTESDAVKESRRAALELLLSDHVGDCLGPCQVACPAGMDIPLMLRQIAAGRDEGAFRTILKDIALPSVAASICHAPCEKACRRGQIDEPVSICLLKSFVAERDAGSRRQYQPECREPCGRAVAVIGAGPAGLACAFYLRRKGYSCTVFDDHESPGGMLRYGAERGILSDEALESDTGRVMDTGVEFRGGTVVGRDVSFDRLRETYDAVFIAVGRADGGSGEVFGLPVGEKGIAIDRRTYATGPDGVFAGGDIVHSRRSVVRSMADGKEAAGSIDNFLSDGALPAAERFFNSRLGRLRCGEKDPAVFGADPGGRIEPGAGGGMTQEQARREARRCLHCECLKAGDCRLRELAAQYGAVSGKYRTDGRKLFVRDAGHDLLVYEPGKCIACGLCVRIAEEAGEETGLGFVGRGFGVRVDVPFGRPLSAALDKSAGKCVRSCPTGALAFKEENR